MEGEPGAGRTAFVREALAQAAALGCRVRYAAADALAVDLPLRAVLDCVHPAGPARPRSSACCGRPRRRPSPAARCWRRWTC
ncbi:hypothetical protein [Streptomyces sp. NBC_01546]|uniref:hypothetical protein n=1 Tax=Streptomyces sp. NBC_01546 TaxID=2975872 RepID=UPI0038709C8C